MASTIQQELAQIILRELNDPRLTGMPSITRVKVSPDLSMADVYMTVMGTQGQQTAAPQRPAPLRRPDAHQTDARPQLRQCAVLKFHLDEDLKKELELLEVLRKVSEENAELDRNAAARGKEQIRESE